MEGVTKSFEIPTKKKAAMAAEFASVRQAETGRKKRLEAAEFASVRQAETGRKKKRHGR